MSKTLATIFSLPLCIVILTACSAPDTNLENNQRPIKIGLLGAYSGDAAYLGIPNRVAVEYATDNINNLGGINGRPIQLIVEDGQCDPKTAANAAQKLINADQVKFILGGFCSGETLALAPIAEQNQVIALSSGSSHPDITHAGDYIFRNYPSDAYQGDFAADFIYHQLNIKRVSVIATNLDYPQGIKQSFIDSFTKLGGAIEQRFDIEPEEKNFQTTLTKIQSTRSELIYLPVNVLNQAIDVIITSRELGLNLPFFGVESWNDEAKIKENLKVLAGSYYTPIATPPAPQFLVNAIQKRCPTCGLAPGVLQSYDAVFVLAQAITKGNFKVEATKQALYRTSYDGLSGHIEFDGNGDLKQASYQVKKIENGEIKIIYP